MITLCASKTSRAKLNQSNLEVSCLFFLLVLFFSLFSISSPFNFQFLPVLRCLESLLQELRLNSYLGTLVEWFLVEFLEVLLFSPFSSFLLPFSSHLSSKYLICLIRVRGFIVYIARARVVTSLNQSYCLLSLI